MLKDPLFCSKNILERGGGWLNLPFKIDVNLQKLLVGITATAEQGGGWGRGLSTFCKKCQILSNKLSVKPVFKRF